MKSDRLDLNSVQEITSALRTAAGQIEHTLVLLEDKASTEDLATYKRMVGKVIIAIYSGLADPVMEGFPGFKDAFYGEDQQIGSPPSRG
jgi:hypothetical protein